jgi:hypothetical protein
MVGIVEIAQAEILLLTLRNSSDRLVAERGRTRFLCGDAWLQFRRHAVAGPELCPLDPSDELAARRSRRLHLHQRPWEASERIYGKRLKALLPLLIESMERRGHMGLASEIRAKLLAMSASTIDRELGEIRQ